MSGHHADAAGGRIGYLLSQYPTYNHTFLLREVCELRALGVAVEVASLGAPDRPVASLPSPEREEAQAAVYIKPRGILAGVVSAARWMVRSPANALRTLAAAIRLAGWHPRRFAAHLAYFGQAALVADWLRARGLPTVHCHFASTVAMLASRLSGVPWSLTIHGPAEFDDVVGFGLAAKVASARLVVVISGFARSQVLRHVPPDQWSKVVVVPLGIAPEAYVPPAERAPSSPVELLTVGRLASVKAQALLIGAVEVLRDRGRSLRLRIVGAGPDHALLESLIRRARLEAKVQLLGPLPQHEVTALYAQTDLFVLPSFAEGVPVVLMEAMAMERACISTRLMGMPELIDDGVNGVLVRPADVDDLVRAIDALLDDPARRLQLGRAARQRVLAAYDLHANVARLRDTLLAS